MNKILKEKIMEAFSSVLPITVIVLVISVVLIPVPSGIILMFLTGAALLVIGMGFFMLGADMAMMPMGEGFGTELTKTSNLALIVSVTLVIGFIITVAEPDLQILGKQTPSIPAILLVLVVSLGAGLALVFAVLRILFKIPLSLLFFVFYLITFAIIFFDPASFVPISFDSGGVTTGPITAPFILAMGAGVAAIRSDKNSREDSFGLVALCSVGPIIAVLLLGTFYKPGPLPPETIEIPDAVNSRDVAKYFMIELPQYIKDVMMSLGAIMFCFLVFELITRRFKRRQLARIAVGFIYTLIGMVVFLTGVNAGFFPVGELLGSELASSSYRWILVPLGLLVGYFIVTAEPAVHVLNKQIEEISSGAITQKMMNQGLSIGMALALATSMLRILLHIPILYIIIPGYSLALLLTFFVPRIFTGIAFDSGGVCSGPMTTTFLLPLAMGACEGVKGNLMTDAFGIIAIVAMTPLIVIQLMGLLYSLRQRETAAIAEQGVIVLTPEEAAHVTVFEETFNG